MTSIYDYQVIALICTDVPGIASYKCLLDTMNSVSDYVDKLVLIVYSSFEQFSRNDFDPGDEIIILDEYTNKYDSIQMFLRKHPSKANDRLLLMDPPDFMINEPNYTEKNCPGFQSLYHWNERRELFLRNVSLNDDYHSHLSK